MSKLSEVRSVAETAFLAQLDTIKDEVFGLSEEEAAPIVHDHIGVAIDTALDEKSDTYALDLIQCCVEMPNLFTREPQDFSCITSNGSPGQVNAQHCVYHNLYDLLSTDLEKEFSEWFQKIQEARV